MKNILLFACFFSFATTVLGQEGSKVITTDITNFWQAFDKITATKDSAEQYGYLDELFLKKGSPGLVSLMEKKRYTAKSYIDAINKYPLFWKSVRANTFKAGQFAKEIEAGITQLKTIYPALKPAGIYFTIGALLTGGTAYNGNVLIACELSMGDSTTVLTELPKTFSYLTPYMATNPINGTVFLNIHEYIHTQQTPDGGYDLLSECVHEGIAEFIAVQASGQASPNSCIPYGKKNDKRIKELFSTELFALDYYNWLYNNFNNEFKMRDLGYYVGYAIAEKYYIKAKNKKTAIKEMIELNLQNKQEVERFVEKSGYFNTSVKKLRAAYEKSRPVVLGIKELKNGDQQVSPSITTITIQFSAKLDKRFTNFDFGPLGEKNVLRSEKFLGFSEDGKSVSIQVELKPNQQYQLLIGEGFRTDRVVSIIPYLIDFKTAAQ
jgi:hypothetical protein